MIDPYRPTRLRNGRPVRSIRFTNHHPYSIEGESQLDGGIWETVSWTRDGHFALAIDDAVPYNPYDLVNVYDGD